MLTWQEVAGALSMVDRTRWPRAASKMQIVLAIAVRTVGNPAFREGLSVETSSRMLARATGLDPVYARQTARELVTERVLQVEREAAGSRGRCYVVNPNIRAWAIAWRAPDELLATRLELLSGRLVPQNPASLPRYGAAQDEFPPRHSAAVNRASAALWRGTTAEYAPRNGAAQTANGDATAPLSRETEVSPTAEAQEERVRSVVQAIEKRGHGDVWSRSLVTRVECVVEQLRDDQVDELVRALGDYNADAGEEAHKPPKVIAWIETVALARLQMGETLITLPAKVASPYAGEQERTREWLDEYEESLREAAPPPSIWRDPLRATVAGGCDDGPNPTAGSGGAE